MARCLHALAECVCVCAFITSGPRRTCDAGAGERTLQRQQQQSNENGTISISIKTITKMTSKIFSRTSHFVSSQRPTMQRILHPFFVLAIRVLFSLRHHFLHDSRDSFSLRLRSNGTSKVFPFDSHRAHSTKCQVNMVSPCE